MHVLHIVIRNTSSLDTTLPLLRKLALEGGHRVSVLYCVGDKRQILRDGDFFFHRLREWGVEQWDFADFLRPAFRWMEPVWRATFRVTSLDALPLRSVLRRPSFEALWSFLSAQPRIRRLLERRLGRLIVDSGRILEELNPDIVLFDHRARVDFYGREYFFDYFERRRVPVLLLPHAPHDIRPTSEFAPFDEQGDAFPDYCAYWVAFHHAKTQEVVPDRPESFIYIGYPGLDSEWMEALRDWGTVQPERPLRALITTRRFYPKGVAVPETEHFVATYEEVEEKVRNAVESLRATGREFDLVIKPHPSASRPHLRELLEDIGVTECEISYEPWYALLPSLDLVISGFTTSLMLPLLFRVPTVIVNSDVQEYVHQWDVLERLYTGCSNFVRKPGDLGATVAAVLEEMESATPAPCAVADAQHIRSFFPDAAAERGRDAVLSLARRPGTGSP